MFDVDAVVIGAGAVGLACAANLGRRGVDTLVLEAASRIGTGVSSRSSEVIHAGLHHPPTTTRARLCVEGNRQLYAYLATRGVMHAKPGKLIVAVNDAEVSQIEAIHAQGRANGVEGLALIDGILARTMEPGLSCTAALWSAETGIFDAYGYMLALQGEIGDAGGSIAFHSPVERIQPLSGGGFRITTGGEEPTSIVCRCLVNSAGLYAQSVAHRIEGFDPVWIPELTLVKGSYFGCTVRAPFSRLIYPAPVDGGLGVHATLDLGGRVRFGPDVEWLGETDPAAVDYGVDPQRAGPFYVAIRKYWADLPDGALTPDYSGCRPKLSGAGEPAADFRIDGPDLHGLEGLVQLFGIESPGLTASLAIAETVGAMSRRLV